MRIINVIEKYTGEIMMETTCPTEAALYVFKNGGVRVQTAATRGKWQLVWCREKGRRETERDADVGSSMEIDWHCVFAQPTSHSAFQEKIAKMERIYMSDEELEALADWQRYDESWDAPESQWIFGDVS